MDEKQTPEERLKARDTFVIGEDRKAWIVGRAKRKGLRGKSEYIRRLIDDDREEEKKE